MFRDKITIQYKNKVKTTLKDILFSIAVWFVTLCILYTGICIAFDIFSYFNYDRRTLLYRDTSYLGYSVEVYELGCAGFKLDRRRSEHLWLYVVNNEEQFSRYTDYFTTDDFYTRILDEGVIFGLTDKEDVYEIGIYTSYEKDCYYTVSFDSNFKKTNLSTCYDVYNEHIEFGW